MSVFFNGRLIESPTTASVVDDSAMRNQNLAVGNVVAIVGKSSAGQPKTALRFGTAQQAKDLLVSGELLDGVLAAFDPSSETNGPSEVVAIRVNPATQATGTMKDSTATTVINLTSQGYGAGQNQVRYKVEAGSTAGLRVTTQNGSKYFTVDNLDRKAFSVRYTGAEATGTMTITGTTLVISAPTGTPIASLDLTVLTTAEMVADYINALPDLDAAVLDGNYTALALNGLDYVTAVDIKTATYNVKANLQAVVDWLNSASEGYVTASRASGQGKPPAVAGFAYLSGGSDGTTLTQDWADSYAALQSIDVQWMAPMSADPAIHAIQDAHLAYMSNVAMKERRGIVGMALGSTDQQAIDAAKILNSDRTSLLHIGHYEYNAAGVLTLYAPYVSAAKIAGAFAGVNPGTPLTNKNFKCRGLERDLRNPTDTDPLIRGGVLCLENTDQGFKVVKSISTWLINNNYNRVEQSTGVAVDYVARSVRIALDVLRGQKGNTLVLSRAKSITESTLKELARQEPQGIGVLAGDETNPAWRNVVCSLDGDVLRVQFECSPVIPVNYVLATIFAVPFSGTAA